MGCLPPVAGQHRFALALLYGPGRDKPTLEHRGAQVIVAAAGMAALAAAGLAIFVIAGLHNSPSCCSAAG